MISENQKKQIFTALKNYVVSYPSQRRAAESLDQISEATVIQIMKGNWKDISEEMWQNLASQLEVNKRQPVVVETLDFQTLILYFSLAKEEGATFAITGKAGSGKTLTGRWYAQHNRSNNVYYLECASWWNKIDFLRKLLTVMGKSYKGSVGEMMETIVRDLRRQSNPLIIFDEVDKLKEDVLLFFITLYNELNGMCGIVWTSTDNIERRIEKGLKYDKMGYQEIFSRIGSRFIELKGANRQEIIDICKANGISQESEYNRIANESAGDLRRVERNFLKDRAKSLHKEKAAL